MEAESLLYSALFFKSLCSLCGGSLFFEYSLSPCPGYVPFVPSNLLSRLSNLVHSLWRSKTEGGRNQAVYFLSSFPSDLQSSLSLSKRLRLLSGSSFHRATQRRYCVSVTTPSSRFGSPNSCLLPPVTDLWAVSSDFAQSGFSVITATVLLFCSGCMQDQCCPSDVQFELYMHF